MRCSVSPAPIRAQYLSPGQEPRCIAARSEDLESLRSGAAASDGVIHTAFIHDFNNYGPAVEADRRAIETIGTVLQRSGRPMIVTSGLALLAPGRLATEEDAPSPDFPRKSEQTAMEFASHGVRASVVRLP